jgi:hypothetical protein
MAEDWMSKQMYHKLVYAPATTTYPTGKMTVLVKDKAKPVSGAWVVVYRFNIADGYILTKSKTGANGRATFKVACHKVSVPYIISAGKGSSSAVSSFYLKPYENLSIVMDLSKQPADFCLNLKPLTQPNW